MGFSPLSIFQALSRNLQDVLGVSFLSPLLRGPATILFISRNTCIVAIVSHNSFVLVFVRYRAIIARYSAK